MCVILFSVTNAIAEIVQVALIYIYIYLSRKFSMMLHQLQVAILRQVRLQLPQQHWRLGPVLTATWYGLGAVRFFSG